MKYIRLICLFILTILFSNAYSQKNYTKAINKSFIASKTQTLEIENIYGNIHIIQTDKDSISFNISISMAQYDEKKAKKQLDEIKIIFGNNKNTVSAKTRISDQFNTLYSFKIDYIISVPAGINLIIDNHFGNIIAEGDLNNYSEFSISYGNIYVDNLSSKLEGKMNYFKMNYSTAHLKQISNAKILSNFSKIKVIQAKDMIVSSKCSRIEVDNTESYISNSQNDNLLINKCSSFTIKRGDNSHISIENGIKNADINLNAGTLCIKNITSFNNILLNTINTKLELNISEQFNYSLKAELIDAKSHFPIKLNYISNNKIEEEKKVIIDAINGEKNTDILPCILIKANKGFINIQ